MRLLDTKRHDALFDKDTFALPIHIIGTGGVGSHVAYELAKLGVNTHPQNTLDLYDGDIIEPHNVPNQTYEQEHVDHHKVDILRQQFSRWAGGNFPTAHPQFVTEQTSLSGIVFLCLDSMQARKDICEASIWKNPNIGLLIETRMDANNAVVFAVDPNNSEHIDIWNDYWFPDEDANNLAGCGGHLSVITAVAMTATIAVQQFIVYAKTLNMEHMANHVRLTLDTWECKATPW